MGLDDIVDTVTYTTLYVIYGVYIGTGLIACVVGGIYAFNVDSPSEYNPGIIFMLGGLAMMLLGMFALYAIRVKNWWMMALVEIINLVLLVATLAAAIIALVWATNTEDPVERAVKDTWKKKVGRDEMEKQNICNKIKSPTTCDTFYSNVNLLITASKTAIAAGDTAGASPAQKKKAAAGQKCFSLLSPWNEKNSNINLRVGSWNSTHAWAAIPHCRTLSASAATVAGSHSNPENLKLYSEAQACDTTCMKVSVDKVREYLKPAAKMFLALFVWIVFTVAWNNLLVMNIAAMEEDDQEEGIEDQQALIGFAFNGVLALLAILCIVIGIVGLVNAAEHCPEKRDCVSNSAAAGVAFGFLLFFVALVAILAIFINKKGVSGLFVLLLRVSQLVYVILGFVFLVVTIILGMASGTISEVNEGMDKNMDKFLAEAKAADKNFCKEHRVVSGVLVENSHELTKAECVAKARKKLKEKTEDSMQTLGVIMAIVVGFQVASVYFGERAVMQFRAGDDDDDEDDGDDEEET